MPASAAFTRALPLRRWALFREKWETIPIRDRSGPMLGPLVDIGLGRRGAGTVILGAHGHVARGRTAA